MARRKTFGLGKPKTTPKEASPRNYGREQALCGAIRERRLVRLMYDDDRAARIFAPHAVYPSTTGKVCVSGVQLVNPDDPIGNQKPRNFEVALITHLVVTDTTFVPDRRFNPHDEQYREGIICRV